MHIIQVSFFLFSLHSDRQNQNNFIFFGTHSTEVIVKPSHNWLLFLCRPSPETRQSVRCLQPFQNLCWVCNVCYMCFVNMDVLSVSSNHFSWGQSRHEYNGDKETFTFSDLSLSTNVYGILRHSQTLHWKLWHKCFLPWHIFCTWEAGRCHLL